MATTTRQTAIFGVEDWKQIYQTYREADFQSYDFETLRKSFIDYLRLYYPETFNDYIESSEFIALLDVMAFMGQALAFRTDLNTRENYIDTAERRDSVVRLANLVSYTAKRNTAAEGYLKVFNVTTTENVVDYNGVNLANITVNWADPTNVDWQEQFTAIINASLVDSQRVGLPGNRQTILGVRTDEYGINLVSGFLPVIPYTATVDGVSMPFEAVTSTSVGRDYVYEPSPVPDTTFNILFRNDQLGFQSANTGYFFLFKQGVLQNQDFNLAERIANRTVDINIEGVNNQDRWLFQLDNIGTISREWQFVENVYTAAEQRSNALQAIYAVTSRANDQITLVFGDGVFSEIPVGVFRSYVRASNGLQYIINPEEMQNVVLPISYTDRKGNLQTITFTCGITRPVSNSQAREPIAEIKQRAPARYYTQNRMVNGEDYNLFPYTQFNSIIKSKALNRASIGTSRYLDLVDNTGKYSSTNTFSSDGALWLQSILPTILFSYTNRNDIADVITNQVQPNIGAATMRQFYYANFPRITSSTQPTGVTWLAGYTWNQSTTLANETTGYFRNTTTSATFPGGTPIPVGATTTTMFKYVIPGSLIRFVPPVGYYFDRNNRLVQGTATRADERMEIWASPQQIVGDGYNGGVGNLSSGAGPVTINNFVPTGAIVDTIIPLLVTDLPNALEQDMAEQMLLFRNFGLGYDNNGSITGTPYTWYLITSTNLDAYSSANSATWSQQYAGNTSGANLDASWLVQFVVQNQNYTITFRGLAYNFGSVLQTRFFFYEDQLVYDSRSGTVIKDFINVLAVNTKPDSTESLPGDIYTTIIDQPIQSDGYVDDFQVLVSYRDSDNDGVPDNPDFFDEIVGPVSSSGPYVFLQQTVDFDNLERYLLVEQDRVSYDYGTLDEIELVKTEWTPGQVFYAYAESAFYELSISVTGVRTLVAVSGWLARPGRQDLYFQYRHNSPLTNRIDPGSTNIVDLYVVTLSYYTAYQNYLRDTTGTVTEPQRPTIDELSTDYQALQDYKMISDNIVVNSVVFKPLFGPKAAAELRATIKVIRAQNSTASTSEIKSSVLAEMNAYFSIDKWNFGDTFYFSELAAYLHSQLGSIISSVVLVPLDQQKSFGDLYEIRSQPNEIFANGAIIDNIDVIEALTSANLRTAPGSGVGGLAGSGSSTGGSSSSGSSGGNSSGGNSGGGGGGY
jgi:uncharacterized membrane protein YgcG